MQIASREFIFKLVWLHDFHCCTNGRKSFTFVGGKARHSRLSLSISADCWCSCFPKMQETNFYGWACFRACLPAVCSLSTAHYTRLRLLILFLNIWFLFYFCFSLVKCHQQKYRRNKSSNSRNIFSFSIQVCILFHSLWCENVYGGWKFKTAWVNSVTDNNKRLGVRKKKTFGARAMSFLFP